jgi:hypothetical protein
MPYQIKWPPKQAMAGLLAVAAFGLMASPSLAKNNGSGSGSSPSSSWSYSVTTTSQCTDPVLTQPFLSWGDSNYYTLTPGESVDNFAGGYWTLSGGASVVTTTLDDGTTGNVLDMPPGSQVVSPTMCVQANYPIARTMILGTPGIQFYVSYAGTASWTNPKNTGQIHGASNTAWSLITPVNLQPAATTGWQLLRITLVSPAGAPVDSQLYNFYVDPYAKR